MAAVVVDKRLAYRLECLDRMILAMEHHGVLSYFGMDLSDLKALSAFIHAEVDGA